MSFLKKLIIFISCVFGAQSVVAMQKSLFGKVLKIYLNKSTKKALNVSKQKAPLNKMPKLSFGTSYLKHMNWKKMAAAGALATGYGLWTWNETVVSAEAPAQEKNWNELSAEEKDKLAAKYGEGIWTYYFGSGLTVNNFEKASIFEQNCMIHAIVKRLKASIEVKNLSDFYYYANDNQRDMLLIGIVDQLARGQKVESLGYIFSKSNKKQKNLLLPWATQIAKSYSHGMDDFVWGNMEEEVLPVFIELLNNGSHSLAVAAYYYCDEKKRDILLPSLIEYIKQKKSIDGLDWIYLHSSKRQRTMLFEALFELATQGSLINKLDVIYKALQDDQKKLLIPYAISYAIESLQQGKDVVGLAEIYRKADSQQQKLLYTLVSQRVDLDIKSQTIGHLKDNVIYVYDRFLQFLHSDGIYTDKYQRLVDTKKLRSLLETTAKHELSYGDDYCIFYHAQIWKLYWREIVYTELYKIKHNEPLNDYTFTRFPINSSCSKNAERIQQQKVIRKKLMQEGRFDDYSRTLLLFLNYALFGNVTNWGSSSTGFFLHDENITEPQITVRDIFERFGLENLYDTNKERFDKLEKDFLELSQHGNLFQIAVPKEHLKKHLYLTTSGGPKIKAQIKKDLFNYAYNKDGEIVDVIENHIVETDDVIELIETLKKNPQDIVNSDQKEFVWIVSDDTVHKAIKDGVKIKSFNTADPEELKRVTNELTRFLAVKLANHWQQPEMTPWDCYTNYKKPF